MQQIVHGVFAVFTDICEWHCFGKVAHHDNRVNEDADWTTIRVHTTNALRGCNNEVVNDTQQYRSN